MAAVLLLLSCVCSPVVPNVVVRVSFAGWIWIWAIIALFDVKVQVGIIFLVIQYSVCIELFWLVILVPGAIQVYQAFRSHHSCWIRNIVHACQTTRYTVLSFF